MKHSQFDQAIVDFTQAIGLKPEDRDAYLKRGSCYWKLKRIRKSARDFRIAKELSSKLFRVPTRENESSGVDPKSKYQTDHRDRDTPLILSNPASASVGTA